ncbi:MAG: anti-sigma factor [Stellaceae bacterium]
MTGNLNAAMSLIASAQRFWDSVRFWRGAAIVLATAACALLVAAVVAREPPNFANRPVIAVLRDTGQHPGWSVRLASSADQIAVDSEGPPPPPPGETYQLWIAGHETVAAQPLGLLPMSGRKIFAESPTNIRLLTGSGELWVTLEKATGTLAEAPSTPPVFRATLKKRS